MASNENIQTIPGNGSSAVTGLKRSAARKPAKTAAAKKPRASRPTEILFKELPNPYKEPIPPYIWIDHPSQSERLLGSTYVVRLGVGGADAVEISIDKGPWLPCRATSGYWWYDWAEIPAGKHTLVARMKTNDGRWFRTPPRACDYR